MAPETSPAPNLAGRVVFVTGGASGVGLRTFRSLARMGAKAYLADINEVGGRAAVDELKREGRDVVFFPLDLGTMQSAKKGADEFLQTEDRLDILVNNAALPVNVEGFDVEHFMRRLSKEYELSPDGIVDTMSVNYFGHYILTNCLLPLLKRTAVQPQSDVRIVTVGSHGHGWLKTQRFATLDQFNEKYGGNSTNGQMMRYCTAKLAETLWAMGLQKQLDAEGANITCILVHPGSIYSEGADKRVKTLPFGVRHAVRFTLRRAFDTPETGSMTSVFAATAPEVLSKPDIYKGAYLMPIKGKAVPSSVVGQALDQDLANELSASTERMVAEILGQGWRSRV